MDSIRFRAFYQSAHAAGFWLGIKTGFVLGTLLTALIVFLKGN